jgi:HD superfamily phosphohydrolase YqeK
MSSPTLHPSLPDWARVGRRRLEHIERVAELANRWAERMGVSPEESARWQRAAWLHDALRDAAPSELGEWAGSTGGPVELLHGPAAAARAAALGERDAGVLDAVRYHSVGWAEWDTVGRVLYCADYLEPGRRHDREGRAALAERFPGEPLRVLQEVAASRLRHLVATGWPLPDPTVRFWNSLLAPVSPA